MTDEIVGFLGDPNDTNNWKRRGLVMGHVQSGKTTNYSALISKAADAGYRIIVVLAGITNSLRYQTQVRLDETFVGKSSLGSDYNVDVYPISYILEGFDGSKKTPRHPYSGTTQSSDFSVKTARSVSASEGNFAEPILFVTKKNEKVLGRLNDWLRGLRQGSPLEGPMLIIDDEADNASVNTSKDPAKTTRINERVRALMKASRRTSYVGYTATPFANIFIDPDTEDEMLDNDLFPEHFIKSLSPPDNYIGASKLFPQESNDFSKACVKEIPDDYQDLLPLKHKSSQQVDELPPSLEEAIIQYLLVRAHRVLENDGNQNSSMLINVSRFNFVQQQVSDLAYRFLHQIRNSVDTWANSNSWKDSKLLTRMASIWDAEFASISSNKWSDILISLKQAISPIEVKLVNMQGGGLDYTDAPDHGLHVIAVGGLALARGLTLEGLTTSYVLRNVGAADTLLQIGRWFGYRPGYEKFCRIHATEQMISHFTEINESVEELRHDLIVMEKQGKRPREFGLKVRHSPTGIAITAANKMRTAESIEVALDLSCKHAQAFELFDDTKINRSHLESLTKFVEELNSDKTSDTAPRDKALIWKNIPAKIIIEFLSKLQLPQTIFAFGNNGDSLLTSYISDRVQSELSHWDIALPFVNKSSDKNRPFPYKEEVFCRSRHSGDIEELDQGKIKVTSSNVVADPNPDDIKFGQPGIEVKAQKLMEDDTDLKETHATLMSRERPILVIHISDFKDKKNKSKLSQGEDLVVSVSVGLPSTNIPIKPKSYAATKRFLELLRSAPDENETDEEVDS